MEEQDFATEHSIMVNVSTWQAQGGMKGAGKFGCLLMVCYWWMRVYGME